MSTSPTPQPTPSPVPPTAPSSVRTTASGIFNRVVLHWKSTLGGVLIFAGATFGAIHATDPSILWVNTAIAVVGALTGALAKDF